MAAPTTTIETTKTEQVYRQLRDLIESGQLDGGKSLSVRRTAQMLGLGPTPVRYGLKRLEQEGLLEHRGKRRSRVVSYVEDEDHDDLVLRYELREQIEGGAARLAAKNMNGWQIDRLRKLAQRLGECWRDGDYEGRYEAAADLWQFLMNNCGNSYLVRIWNQYRLAPPRPRSIAFEQEVRDRQVHDRTDAATRDPEELVMEMVDAIAAHDQDAAERLMKQRIRQVTDVLREMQWEDNGEANSERASGSDA